MPTVAPKIKNLVNGIATRFNIEANDPELSTIFEGNRGEASLGVFGTIEDKFEGIDTGDITSTIQGSYNIGVGELSLGTVNISGSGSTLELTGLNDARNKLENIVKNDFTNDERERILGDWSYDADSVNDLYDASSIWFRKQVEETKEKVSDATDGDRESQKSVIAIAGAGVIGVWLLSKQ